MEAARASVMLDAKRGRAPVATQSRPFCYVMHFGGNIAVSNASTDAAAEAGDALHVVAGVHLANSTANTLPAYSSIFVINSPKA
jgi:polyribonucleotide nucleotidyltransferase